MEGNLFLPAFRRLRFADANKPLIKRLLYKAFQNAKKQCDKWGEFRMNIAPYEEGKPIYYEFTACPTAEFAKKHGLLEVMPALCNPDYEGMELYTQSSCARQHAQTAASATTPYAETATNTASYTRNTATRRATGGTNEISH